MSDPTDPTPRPPLRDDPRADQRIRTMCLVILTIIAVGAALVALRPVLVPLLVALLFTYCVKPVIDFQMARLGLPRGVAIAGAALVALGLIALAGVLLVAFVSDLTNSLPAYQRQFDDLMKWLADAVPAERLGLPADPTRWVTFTSTDAQQVIKALLGSAAEVLGGIGLVLIFVLFLLVGGSGRPLAADSLLGEIEARAQRYILQTVGFSVVTGVLVGLSLRLVGVKFSFAFGFLAFLLNFIPTIGPLLATLLPLPVVVLDRDLSLTAKVLAFALPLAVQLTFAVVQPKVQGGAQDLHPVTTMAALVFFGTVWGILGAALAVPVTGVIKIVLERIPTTRMAADWMAGRFDSPRPPPPERPGV